MLLASSTRGFLEISPWLALLVGVVVLGTIVILMVRRLLTNRECESDGTAFTLQELREMRDRGELTEEEFQRARTAMVGQVQRSGDSKSTMPPGTDG